MLQTKKENHSVSQSNHLIRAAYDLSLNEKRLLMLALTKVNPKKWEQDWEISVHANEWASVFSKEIKHSYGEIESAATQLEDRKLTFRTGPDVNGKKTFESGRWVAWARYIPGEGRVTLEIPKGLRKYLAFAMLEEDGFTSYKLMAAAKLRTVHSIRLYEQMMSWKSTGTLYITVEDLRDVLELDGKYKLFSDLRKWVINPSMKDINKNSDFQVDWDVHKKAGRKITSLVFRFQKKKQKELDFGDLAEGA
ncbi:replication initiation protein [Gilvimarinus chinensis]|uniref:replication initiation protein n=1 Tax=Gilvimarinus chinensis TaxID=396005 RepID=UPI0014616C12|nr:replication initiation protein [Gilvimarinus chinensis]